MMPQMTEIILDDVPHRLRRIFIEPLVLKLGWIEVSDCVGEMKLKN